MKKWLEMLNRLVVNEKIPKKTIELLYNTDKYSIDDIEWGKFELSIWSLKTSKTYYFYSYGIGEDEFSLITEDEFTFSEILSEVREQKLKELGI